ncbi:MAG: geranylgeranyl reductase family protein [Anaerolineae bacterium]|nr:geranylgeranyl reductase family protein [Anaerolineae bacterium]
MVLIDRSKCAYCGACVSVCPVGALDLAETQLIVAESCTDCGLCLSACPTGALHAAPGQGHQLAAGGLPAKREYDIVVVGAGPGGSMAAREAAQAGLSVLLLEKRQEIGSPVRCAEGIAHEQLLPFLPPDPRWISATVTAAEFTLVTPDGKRETQRGEGGLGYVLERRVFDRVLAEEAAAAGAEVRVKTAAIALITEKGTVRGVRVRSPFGEVDVASQVVIGADGVESRVGAWAGLKTRLRPRDCMSCAQFLLAGLEIDPACTCYHVDASIAPGGYAWVFPKGEGRANVGLGVQSDIADRPALDYLIRFVESQPHLAQGSPVTLITGGVPIAPQVAPMVTDGLMLVGDAARQVDPITGGGIATAMAAGRLAAQVAAECIAAGDVSAAALQDYEKRWHADWGRRLARRYRLKERFPPEARTSREFVRVFAVAVGSK